MLARCALLALMYLFSAVRPQLPTDTQFKQSGAYAVHLQIDHVHMDAPPHSLHAVRYVLQCIAHEAVEALHCCTPVLRGLEVLQL
jgi:hypothetical protein